MPRRTKRRSGRKVQDRVVIPSSGPWCANKQAGGRLTSRNLRRQALTWRSRRDRIWSAADNVASENAQIRSARGRRAATACVVSEALLPGSQ
jgi:hypothetical protein